ncbi:MAG: SprT-like domain-containing protein [Rhodothermales bacterium]|nr:SprT-like domain-containing protein [Rhodothermales bacterium]
MAEVLLLAHGLSAWSFRFDNARTRAGVCRYDDRVIGLSRHYVRANEADEVRGTILHEIAHALAGPQAGHGPRWKRIARELGAPTERCTQADMDIDPRYTLWCVKCGKRMRDYHRRPRRDLDSGRWRHRSCGGSEFRLTAFVGESPAKVPGNPEP